MSSALIWADHVILSDQNSTDDTRLIASKFPRVTVLENQSQEFNERENRENLLAAARNFGPSNVILSLDADERISGNAITGGFFQTIRELEPGTGIQVNFANLATGQRKYWEVPLAPIGFRDDGRSPDNSLNIHFPRTTFNSFENVVRFSEVKLMHMQFLDRERVLSKHNWYQMWERLNTPAVTPISLYRKYHHMDSIPKSFFRDIPDEWIVPYRDHGIEPLAHLNETNFWWDKKTKEWLDQFGEPYFRRVAVDDRFGKPVLSRSLLDRLMFRYLRATQPHYVTLKRMPQMAIIYALDAVLNLFWRF